MAQRVITTLVDDLDGTEIADGKGETVAFSLDGKSYAIDLTTKNATELRKALAPYVDAAKPVSGSRGGRQSARSASGPSAHVLRQWAQENGYDVSERGRVPSAVREAYATAH